MPKIYYAITPTRPTIAKGVTRYVNKGDYDDVYNIILLLTEDAQAAINASNWCELACIGDLYEHDEFEIEIIED